MAVKTLASLWMSMACPRVRYVPGWRVSGWRVSGCDASDVMVFDRGRCTSEVRAAKTLCNGLPTVVPYLACTW